MSTSSETRSPCRKAMMLMARRAPGDGCDGGRRGSSSFPPGGGSFSRRDRQPCFCLLSAVLKPLFTLRKLTTRYLSLRSAGFPARRERNLLQKGLSVKNCLGTDSLAERSREGFGKLKVALVERQRRSGVEARRWAEDHARWRTDQPWAAKAAAHDSRIRQLHRLQSSLHPRLRRPPSQWRTNQLRLCRVGRKPTCQSANGQAATNALVRARRPSALTGLRASDERRSA